MNMNNFSLSEAFRQEVRHALEALNVPARRLSLAAGLRENYISNFLNGKSSPSLATVQAIREAVQRLSANDGT